MMTKRFLFPGDGNEEDGRPKGLGPTRSSNTPAAPSRNGRSHSLWTTIDAEFWPTNRRENVDLKRALYLFMTGLREIILGILQMSVGGMYGLALDVWIMVTPKGNATKNVPAPKPEERRWN